MTNNEFDSFDKEITAIPFHPSKVEKYNMRTTQLCFITFDRKTHSINDFLDAVKIIDDPVNSRAGAYELTLEILSRLDIFHHIFYGVFANCTLTIEGKYEKGLSEPKIIRLVGEVIHELSQY